MKEKMNNEKRVAGGIVGLVVGDALGVPVEFETREKLKQYPVSRMMGYGTYSQPAGSWSDDSSMTIATIDSIISCYGYSGQDLRLKFENWLMKNHYTPCGITFDVGATTKRALTEGKGMKKESDNGNGSLMRMLPFGLWCDSTYLAINDASAITHAHERSKLACRIYCDIIKKIMGGIELRKAIAAAMWMHSGDKEIEHYKRLKTLEKLDESEIESSGYVVSTLEAALWCALTTKTYRDCVLKAVNLGGDTDTIAAVAGGIAGVMYGIDEIPKEWVNALQRSNYVVNMANMFAKWCA